MQDIYPEIAGNSGIWRQTSPLYKVLLFCDKQVTKYSDQAIVLSDDMEQSLEDRGFKPKTSIINNFALSVFDACANQPTQLPPSKRTRFIFAGNLGRFQSLDDIALAFMGLDYTYIDAELHFVGDGKHKAHLEELTKDCDRIIFHGQQPYEITTKFIQECDMAIVSLTENIYRYAYPSKTLTYMSMGIPMLALVEPNSSLARELSKQNIGIIAPNRTSNGIRQSFEFAYNNLSTAIYSWTSIKHHYLNNYSANTHTQKWADLINDMQNPR